MSDVESQRYERLWQAVILQALVDVTIKTKVGMLSESEQEATRRWLCGTLDMRRVCDMASIPPEKVTAAYRRGERLHGRYGKCRTSAREESL